MRIISLDGGGYLGLSTAAFIEEAERHFDASCYESFDMFCGTSTGAIIALALASGLSGRDVVALYQDFGSKVFNNPFPGARLLRTLRGAVVARYSNKALKDSLKQAFKDLTLGDLRAKKKSVVVTAFCLTTGRPRIFKTDHSMDLSRDNGYLVRDVALASASAPIFLPVVKLRSPTTGCEEWYCDGGVFANHPALIGYAEAVSHLGTDPRQVRILSLSTPRADLAERASGRNLIDQFLMSRGLVSWGTKLASVMIDSTSLIAHETLRRLIAWHPDTAGHYARIEIQKPVGVAMDIANCRATETLRQLGADYAYKTEVRNHLRSFFEQ